MKSCCAKAVSKECIEIYIPLLTLDDTIENHQQLKHLRHCTEFEIKPKSRKIFDNACYINMLSLSKINSNIERINVETFQLNLLINNKRAIEKRRKERNNSLVVK